MNEPLRQEATEWVNVKVVRQATSGWAHPAGWTILFRPIVEVDVPIPKVSEAELPELLKNEEPVSLFSSGYQSLERFNARVQSVVEEFAQDFFKAMQAQGIRVGWRLMTDYTFGDGEKQPLGVAVHLHRNGEFVLDSEAVEIGNKVNFSKDGCRITVKAIEYGILAGGEIYKVLEANPKAVRPDVYKPGYVDELLSTLRVFERSSALLGSWSAKIAEQRAEMERELKRCQTEQEYGKTAHTFRISTRLVDDGLKITWHNKAGDGRRILGYRRHGSIPAGAHLSEWKAISGSLGEQVVDSCEDGSVVLRLAEGREFSFTFLKLKQALFGELEVCDRIDFLISMPAREKRFEKLATDLQKTISEAAKAIREAMEKAGSEGGDKTKSEVDRIKKEVQRKVAGKIALVDAVNEELSPLQARFSRLPEGQEKNELGSLIMQIKDQLLP